MVELLFVMALFGLVSAIAFAPTIVVVRRFEDVRAEVAREQHVDFCFRRIVDELRTSPDEFVGGPAVVLIHRDVLGDRASDRLAFWSDHGGEPGVRALRLFEPGVGVAGKPGLYRWVLPFSAPEDVNWDRLDPAEGRLLFPEAESLRFSVLAFDEREWSDEYKGSRPRGIRVAVKRDEEEFSYEDWLPPK